MPPKLGEMCCDDVDDLVRVARGQADRERLDPGQRLEEDRLALHHRQRGLRADIAETEHGRAVGDDGDQIALGGQLVDLAGSSRMTWAGASAAGGT